MCIRCHTGLSDEKVIEQLREGLLTEKYDGWNETSIDHLSLIYLGVNGVEAQKLASELFDKYIFWKENNRKMSDGSFFGEPSADYVRQVKSNSDELIANKTYHDEFIKSYLSHSHE